LSRADDYALVAAQVESLVSDAPDIDALAGHIACESRSRSEVVVPIVRDGRLRAVLDADSDALDAFDESDRDGLVKIASLLAAVD
jgi:GAF domain-containing protein